MEAVMAVGSTWPMMANDTCLLRQQGSAVLSPESVIGLLL